MNVSNRREHLVWLVPIIVHLLLLCFLLILGPGMAEGVAETILISLYLPFFYSSLISIIPALLIWRLLNKNKIPFFKYLVSIIFLIYGIIGMRFLIEGDHSIYEARILSENQEILLPAFLMTTAYGAVWLLSLLIRGAKKKSSLE